MVKIIIFEFQDVQFASRARKEAYTLAKENVVYLVGYNSNLKSKSILENKNLTIIEFPLLLHNGSSSINKFLNIFYLNLRIGLYLIFVKADVYFMHNLKLFYPAIITKYIHKSKLVYDAHELHIAKRPNISKFQSFLTFYDKIKELFLLNMADIIIQASEERAIFFSKYYKSKKPLVIENHSFYEDIKRTSTSRIRFDCQLKESDYLLVFTGNVTIGGNQKIDFIIKSLGLTDANIHLAILGKCNTSVKNQLLLVAENSKVKERVHFIDPVPSEYVVSYISGADLAVIPIYGLVLNSRFSALNKVSQSLMAGLPIICSNYLNLRNLLNENGIGQVGELFDVNDQYSFVYALNNCLKPNNYLKYKENAFVLAKKRINWDLQERKLLDAINSLNK